LPLCFISGMLRPLPLSDPFSAGAARGLLDLAAVLARQSGQKNMTIPLIPFTGRSSDPAGSGPNPSESGRSGLEGVGTTATIQVLSGDGYTGRPLIIALPLRKESAIALRWITERLQMETKPYLSHMLYRQGWVGRKQR